MKKGFLGEHFLLQSDTACQLYQNYAQNSPIIDFHNHLPVRDIAEDRRFKDLTELWLEDDHYKWRAMRANGIDEAYITGDASNREKFKAWASTVPFTLRNPLYHWTHLELKRYFDIDELLSEKTADKIYDRANEMIGRLDFSARSLLDRMNVELLCTSDDPISELVHHRKLNDDGFGIRVLPTWRPDSMLAIDNLEKYNRYIDRLEEAANLEIKRFDQLCDAIIERQDYFHKAGCRLSDHGIDQFPENEADMARTSRIFQLLREKREIGKEDKSVFRSTMLHFLAVNNHKLGWVQQFHVGAIRNTNPRMARKLGKNTGFDGIGNSQNVEYMAKFLGALDNENQLAPTILYNNNPSDNYAFAAMAGNFQDGRIPGKIQYGAAWWFLDQKEGMEMQINVLSNLGLLSRFIGMVTDSRSFLSFPRHEYFRRILCNMLGSEVEEGLLPDDHQLIGAMIENICYGNARAYFGFCQQ